MGQSPAQAKLLRNLSILTHKPEPCKKTLHSVQAIRRTIQTYIRVISVRAQVTEA